MAPPLEHHVELSDQKVNVVSLLGLEGLRNDPGSLSVLLTPKRQPIHFQNHVAHLELPTVMGRTSSLHRETQVGVMWVLGFDHPLRPPTKISGYAANLKSTVLAKLGSAEQEEATLQVLGQDGVEDMFQLACPGSPTLQGAFCSRGVLGLSSGSVLSLGGKF